MRRPYFAKSIKNSTIKKEPPKYPEGYDMSLTEIMDEYNLNPTQIDELKAKHAEPGNGIAYAILGHQVYYRRHQIESIFGKPGENNGQGI